MKIREMREKLDRREISAPELTAVFLERIRRAEPRLNSYITVLEEQAQKQAAVIQERIQAGAAGGLDGIPISVKDNICTKGIPTTCGSRVLADFVPDYNAAVIDRTAGAVLLGKTNMDEFAMGSGSQTSYFGAVGNPYNPDFVPGGSSGGAAAAVAADLCPAALCSDTGGSVRQPAAFCGVTGLKPTYGLVSRFGLVAFASGLDQIGVIAKSAEDCAMVLAQIAGRDQKDMTTWNKPTVNPLERLGKSIRGLRIGTPAEYYGSSTAPAVREAVLRAAQFYAEQGCVLVETAMPSLEYAVPAYYLLSSAQAAANLARYDGLRYGFRETSGDGFAGQLRQTRETGFGREVKRRILLGNYALSAEFYADYYQNAARIQTRIIREFARQFEQCDLLLTPTAPTAAYPKAERPPVKNYMDDFCAAPVNLAGLPAISTVCGYDEQGMPIGMSLIGPAFSENLLIGAADAFEQAFVRREAEI